MPAITWKRVLLIVVVVLAVAAAAWALRPQPVPVDIALVEAGALEVSVEDEAVTRIRDVYTVSAPVGGKTQRSPRRVGDSVEAGETVVAVIEPGDPGFLDIRTQRVSEAQIEATRAAINLAEAQLRQAQAQLDFAQSDLTRAMELARRETISQRALDQARFEVLTAESGLASAQATLEVRRRELASAEAGLIQPGGAGNTAPNCCINVMAPTSGRVLRVLVESEQVVQPGTALVEIGDPGNLEIVVDLLSRDAVRVEPGASARITGWGGAQEFEARVLHVEPSAFTRVSALGIEEQRVRTILEFADESEAIARLGHNFRVVARILVWEGRDIVTVPLGALFRDGESWAVFVVDGEVARVRRIAIGERTMRRAQVLDGLAVGEAVLLHPSDRIADGVAVAVRE
jgi:HlyD family secretion protein